MTLKPKQIQKIIDRLLERKSIGAITRITRYVRNTVKKYLRQYGLLNDPHPFSQQGGPPSLGYPSKGSTSEIDKLNGKVTELNDKLQRANELGQGLTQQLDQEKLKNKNLTRNLDDANAQKGILTNENKDLKQENTKLTDELILRNRKYDQLQDKCNEQHEETIKMMLDHKSEMKILKDRDIDRERHLEENRNTLQHLGDGVTAMATKIEDQEETINTRTEQRDQFEKEVKRLQKEQENDLIKCTVVGVVGVGAGITIGRWLSPPKIIYNAIPIPQDSMTQPDIQDLDIGATLEPNTSRTPCSELILIIMEKTPAPDTHFSKTT
jgi:DNA repair exonuclease SbcCD ATPase subunit